jgi:hypothetical protein
MTASNAEQTAGFMVHGIFNRTVLSAFDSWAAGEADEDDGEEDYRKLLKRKVWRVVHTLSDGEVTQRIVINWASVFLDQLWMQLQHLDAAGGLLFHLVRRGHSNPFCATVRKYTALLFTNSADGHAAILFWYFDSVETGYDGGLSEIIDDLRLMAASLCCQITWRCIWLFESFPYALILVVHPLSSEGEQKDFCKSFLRLPFCELDPNCSQKVQTQFKPRGWLALWSDENFRLLMSNFGSVGRCTSMAVERVLAKYKHATPMKHPHAERFSAAGMLSQWSGEHLADGGWDTKTIKVQDLIADYQTPIHFNKTQSFKQPGRARPEKLYAIDEYHALLQRRGVKSLPWAEHVEARRQFERDFASLPAGQQDLYKARASGNASDLDLPPSIGRYNLEGDLLWGVSERRHPIRPELAAELIKELKGTSEVGGFSSYESLLRERFLDKLLVEDVDAVPPAFHYDKKGGPCWQVCPGICRDADSTIFASCLRLVASIRRFVKDVGAGSFVELQLHRRILDDEADAAGEDNVLRAFFYVAFLRKRDPHISLHVPCHKTLVQYLGSEVRPQLAMQQQDGLLCVNTDFAIAKLMMEGVVGRSKVVAIKHKHENIIAWLYKVWLLGTDGDGCSKMTVWQSWGAGVKKPPDPKPLGPDLSKMEQQFMAGFQSLDAVGKKVPSTPVSKKQPNATKAHLAKSGDEPENVLLDADDDDRESDASCMNDEDRLLEEAAKKAKASKGAKASKRAKAPPSKATPPTPGPKAPPGKAGPATPGPKPEEPPIPKEQPSPFVDVPTMPLPSQPLPPTPAVPPALPAFPPKADPSTPGPKPSPSPSPPPPPPCPPSKASPSLPCPDDPELPPLPDASERLTSLPRGVVAKPEDHILFWLTRTNKGATCRACNNPIDARSPRLAYHPDPSAVKDKRAWGKMWWHYFHPDRHCLKHILLEPSNILKGIETMITDFQRLPKKENESLDLYWSTIEAAKTSFIAELKAAHHID